MAGDSQPALQPDLPPVKSGGKVMVFIFLIVVVLLAVALIMYSASNSLGITDKINSLVQLQTNTPAVASQSEIDLSVLNKQLAENPDRPYLGNPEAGLVIVEFADFQCPLCQQQYATIREVISQYDQEVKFIYRHFPSINENSITMSEASECANAQGKFWQFHDKAFQTLNGGVPATIDLINQIAKQSGVDFETFDKCLSTHLYQNKVVEDVYDAEALGVRGTPTFFVDGFKMEGVYTAEDWTLLIESVKDTLNQKTQESDEEINGA